MNRPLRLTGIPTPRLFLLQTYRFQLKTGTILAILRSMTDSCRHHPPLAQLDLQAAFQTLNCNHFDGFLDPPQIDWNTRLRTCAGRFSPGRPRSKSREEIHPKIEIARYIIDLERAEELVYDVLGHEMIHYWLWVRQQPYGHTTEFYSKLEEMGVSRYNPVPQRKRAAYVYHCKNCGSQFPSKKFHAALACAACCQKYSKGRFDHQFLLALKRAPWLPPSANV
jgi:predicted SprT family Zn-dependent metalloprotease